MGSERVDVGMAYEEARQRFSELGRGLDAGQAATSVPALPGWTVKDTYAHVASIATEVVAGRGPTGVPDDEWTGARVAARTEMALGEVLDEWDESGPVFASMLSSLGDSAPTNPAVDVWTHEVDVRGALGVVVPADGGLAESILDRLVRRGIGRRWGELGIPAVRIVTPDEEWIAGEGDPVATLRTSRFELGRVLLGRRSPDQLRALAWEGADPAPWIDQMHVFGPATVDVVDQRRG